MRIFGMITRLLIGAAVLVLLTADVMAADWPQWKGSRRDNVSPETGLNTDWNAKQPVLSRTSTGLGIGFSNLCFTGDRIYTLGDFNDRTHVIALDRKTSKILWKTEIGQGGRVSALDGPKATPASNGKFVAVLNQCGILSTLDGRTGKVVWTRNMHKDFDGFIMKRGVNRDNDWGYAESPLIDGDRLICCPGGKKGTVLALDLATGKELWRTKDVTDNASYASLVKMETPSGPVCLISTEVSFLGIRIEDGKVLWRLEFDGFSPSLCCDAVWQDNYIVYSYAVKRGYFGARLIDGNPVTAEKTFTLEEMGNKQHGMLLLDGYVYTTTDRGGLLCFDVKTGKLQWKNRRLRACYTMTCFQKHLIIRNDKTGELTLLEANPKEYVEKGKITQPDRSDERAWTYPVVMDGKLYIRDQDKLFEYDLH